MSTPPPPHTDIVYIEVCQTMTKPGFDAIMLYPPQSRNNLIQSYLIGGRSTGVGVEVGVGGYHIPQISHFCKPTYSTYRSIGSSKDYDPRPNIVQVIR